MRTTIHNLIAAKKAEREESGEAGFSLIELIVVVVIIGILAAVAIPIFLGIQQQSKDNALKGIAGNAAAAVAADLAVDPSSANYVAITGGGGAVPTTIFKSDEADVTVTLPAAGTNVEIGNFCVTAAAKAGGTLVGGANATSGPACP